MRADAMPESLERFQLQQRVWARDYALDFMKSGEHEPASATTKGNTE
jgi:hypothetical protein